MQSVESKDTAAAADVGNNNIWMNLNLDLRFKILFVRNNVAGT